MASLKAATEQLPAESGAASSRHRPIKVVDIHLDRPLQTISGLHRFNLVQALVRMHGAPLGWARIPIHGDRCLVTAQRQAIVKQLRWRILVQLVEDRLRTGTLTASEAQPRRVQDESLEIPSVTVAVCTRDRPDSLETCLASLERIESDLLEVIVVDNAPSSDATRRLVASRGPRFRYIREDRPGLDWARNRTMVEARGDVIAFTDDDCVVDPGWTNALALTFAESPEVSAVTGLVVPYELETEAQILFEVYGGFGRGFRRRWHHVSPKGRAHIGSGNFGTGANMAFRRSTLEGLGGFDPALDVGTVTNGGGDIEMFFRVLQEGDTLVYEPAAIVRHRHRRDYASLHRQLTDHGIGFSSYVTRSVLAYPNQLRNFLWFTRWWLWWWILRRIVRSLISPASFPIELILAELKGGVKGLTRYRPSARQADRIKTQATGPPLNPEPPC